MRLGAKAKAGGKVHWAEQGAAPSLLSLMRLYMWLVPHNGVWKWFWVLGAAVHRCTGGRGMGCVGVGVGTCTHCDCPEGTALPSSSSATLCCRDHRDWAHDQDSAGEEGLRKRGVDSVLFVAGSRALRPTSLISL